MYIHMYGYILLILHVPFPVYVTMSIFLSQFLFFNEAWNPFCFYYSRQFLIYIWVASALSGNGKVVLSISHGNFVICQCFLFYYFLLHFRYASAHKSSFFPHLYVFHNISRASPIHFVCNNNYVCIYIDLYTVTETAMVTGVFCNVIITDGKMWTIFCTLSSSLVGSGSSVRYHTCSRYTHKHTHVLQLLV